MVVVYERDQEHKGKADGINSTFSTLWRVEGESTSVAAISLAKSAALDSVMMEGYDLSHRTYHFSFVKGSTETWEIAFHYKHPQNTSQGDEPLGLSGKKFRLSFDIGSEEATRYHSLGTQIYYKDGVLPADVPDLGDAINVNKEGEPEGVKIIAPVIDMGLTSVVPANEMTETYHNQLADTLGKINDSSWRGKGAGEVLFTGVSGSENDDGSWDLDYQFKISRNVTNLVVGGVTVTEKKGWELIEPQYDDSGYGNLAPLLAMRLHSVYEEADYSILNLEEVV